MSKLETKFVNDIKGNSLCPHINAVIAGDRPKLLPDEQYGDEVSIKRSERNFCG